MLQVVGPGALDRVAEDRNQRRIGMRLPDPIAGLRDCGGTRVRCHRNVWESLAPS